MKKKVLDWHDVIADLRSTLNIVVLCVQHLCGKMPGCFTDITSITARTCKLLNNMQTKPARDRVFHTKQLAYLTGGKKKFNIQIVAISLDKVTNLFLSDNRKMAYVR